MRPNLEMSMLADNGSFGLESMLHEGMTARTEGLLRDGIKFCDALIEDLEFVGTTGSPLGLGSSQTPYFELSEKEKFSDRSWAKQVINIIEENKT